MKLLDHLSKQLDNSIERVRVFRNLLNNEKTLGINLETKVEKYGI